VCGKNPEVAVLQDLLIYGLKGLSQVAVEARINGVDDDEVNRFILEATFSTLTNVSFDASRFVNLIRKTVNLRDALKQKVKDVGGSLEFPDGPAYFAPAETVSGLIEQGSKIGVKC
jgi:hydroxylamine reductase